MPGALSGVRVVDFGHYVAGPLAATLLGDQGADVIHVDPPQPACWRPDADAFLNRGKRRITLDLKRGSDLAIAERVIDSADVVIENFRPGVMERLGLGAEAMTARKPGLIYCSLPGFAEDDERARLPAWEGIVDAATGNCRARNGEAPPDWDTSRPTYSAIPLASNFAAFLGATSIVMALIARHRCGLGQRISVPLFDAMFTAIGPAGAYVNARGLHEPRPIDVNGSGTYRCSDGRYIQFDPSNHRFLTWFAEAAGISDWGPDLLDRVRLQDRQANARLHAKLAEFFATRPADDWECIARQAGAVLARVRTPREWLATEHARQSGAVVELDDPELGPTAMPGLAVTLTGSPGGVQGPRHVRDADRAAILTELEHAQQRRAAPGADGERAEHADRADRAEQAGRAEQTEQADLAEQVDPAERGEQAKRAEQAEHAEHAEHAEQAEQAELRLPLAGLRVLDLCQVLAGPTSGRLLAEFGADVIKIYPPQSRIGAAYLNRGKRTILLDLESPDGKQVFFKLAESADVVIQNFARGQTEKYGIGYHQLEPRKPDLIYVSLSCYGYGGVWDAGRGYERQGQAVTGVMERVGEVPAILGPYNLVDIGTGVLTAFGTGLAVYERLRSGRGQHVFTSLAQTATVHQGPYMLDYAGKVFDEPRGWTALGTGPGQRFYQGRDGWFFVGVADGELERLGKVLGLGPREPTEAELEACFAGGGVEEWVARLRAAGISAQVVVDLAALMTDAAVRARGLSVTQVSEEVGEVTYPGISVRMSRTPPRVGSAARQPGADAASVLGEVGYGDQMEALERVWAVQTRHLPSGW